MLTLLLSLSVPAQATTPEAVLARVAEVATLRGTRLATGAPVIAEEMYRTAAGGDIATELEAVEDVAAKKAYGVGVVDVPIARLWAAINDDAGKVERTRLSFAEVLVGSNCSIPRTVFQYLPTPFIVSDRWWVSDFEQNQAAWDATGGRVRELRWQSNGDRKPTTGEAATWSDSGMQVAWTKGAWWLVDIDGKNTLVEYYTWSDPGGSLPAGPVSSFSAGGITDTIATVAELAKDGPGCAVK